MEGFVGEIRYFAGSYVPKNWLLCQGQTLSVWEPYDLLFSVLGHQFGGGTFGGGANFDNTLFQLPNLSAPLPGMQAIICFQGTVASQSAWGEGTLGEIRYFAGTSAPTNWYFCQGQTLPIGPNSPLFSLMLNQFGGDGVTNFQLPLLSGPVPQVQAMLCGNGLYPDLFGD